MSDVIELSEATIDGYVKYLNDKKPFGLSRWGDGEWRSVLAENDKCWAKLAGISKAWRKGKTNKSGHSFPPEMGVEMRNLLISKPKHRLAVAQRFANANGQAPFIHLAHWMKQWLNRNGLGELRWDDADIIVRALYTFQFEPFLEGLMSNPVIMIGPSHLSSFKLFQVQNFVECPRRNAYLAHNNLFRTASTYLARAQEHTVVSISMGPAAAILVDKLRRYTNGEHTVLDLGSIWDSFVGQKSRRYMERPDLIEYVQKLKKQYA